MVRFPSVDSIADITQEKKWPVIMFLDSVPPNEQRLGLTDTFTFWCHSDLACFNKCCSNKHLPLTPYDVLRLKTALHVHSDDFLSRYTLYRLGPDSGFPIISLKMGDDSQKACPFVRHDGCKVYEDRPTACRVYPLGRASGVGRGETGWEEFFFRLDTPACLGVKEGKLWRVDTWLDDQGLNPYIEMNNRVLDILFRRKKVRTTPLDERQLQKVMVACYNLDVFREFVFITRFLDLYEIDDEIRSKITDDDAALLTLGFEYLHRTLFPDPCEGSIP